MKNKDTKIPLYEEGKLIEFMSEVVLVILKDIKEFNTKKGTQLSMKYLSLINEAEKSMEHINK